MQVEQPLSGDSAPVGAGRTAGFLAAPMMEGRAASGRFGRTGRRLDLHPVPGSRPTLMLSQTAAELIGDVVRPVLRDLPSTPTLTTGHPLLETSPQERIAIQRVLAGELDAAIVCGGIRPQDASRGLRTLELGFFVAVLTIDKQASLRSVRSNALRQLLVAKDADWLAFGGPDKAIQRQFSADLQERGASVADLIARLLVPGDALDCTSRSASAQCVTITSLADYSSDTGSRRLLAIDAVQPSLVTARSGIYPAACPVHLVWHQNRSGLAQALGEHLRVPAVIDQLAATLTVK